MSPLEIMQRVDALLSHVWMVRTFLKHSDEAEESDLLPEVIRDLYDTCLAVGPAWDAQDVDAYRKVLQKKLPKLRAATRRFAEIQPEVSAHTNFKMALRSLQTAVNDIDEMGNGEWGMGNSAT
jgi:hypothetical protein